MSRSVIFFASVALIAATIFTDSRADAADPLVGTYVEARTCQVYTGPCFANGEVGSTGKDAIMTWHMTRGEINDVSLKGLSVSLICRTSHTLGFNGFDDAAEKRAIVIVDRQASDRQAAALKGFALAQTGLADSEIAEVYRRDIEMDFDFGDLTATVDVEDFAKLVTRKARPGDCICSNESAYYPPLTKLTGSVPGVTIEGDVKARRLGGTWSIPDSRTAYLGTFLVDAESLKLASNF